MLNFFTKKNLYMMNNPFEITSPLDGRIIELKKVSDPAFSSLSLGKGIAIVPQSNILVSPISGTITALFPTFHAFGIQSDEGIEVLVHIGIDTVNLNGKGFKSFVKQGQYINKGDKMIDVDFDYIKKQGLDTTTMIVITNHQKYHLNITSNQIVKKNDALIFIEEKC